jgi:hypothetical protein
VYRGSLGEEGCFGVGKNFLPEVLRGPRREGYIVEGGCAADCAGSLSQYNNVHESAPGRVGRPGYLISRPDGFGGTDGVMVEPAYGRCANTRHRF